METRITETETETKFKEYQSSIAETPKLLTPIRKTNPPGNITVVLGPP